MRKYFLFTIIILTAIIFTARLIFLQAISYNSAAAPNEDVAISIIYDYPERGYIYDRNDTLLVSNQPAYDVMIVPREVKTIDTLELCNLLSITKENFFERIEKAKKYSHIKPSVFINQLSKEEYAYLQEKLRKFHGFYIQKKPKTLFNPKCRKCFGLHQRGK